MSLQELQAAIASRQDNLVSDLDVRRLHKEAARIAAEQRRADL